MYKLAKLDATTPHNAKKSVGKVHSITAQKTIFKSTPKKSFTNSVGYGLFDFCRPIIECTHLWTKYMLTLFVVRLKLRYHHKFWIYIYIDHCFMCISLQNGDCLFCTHQHFYQNEFNIHSESLFCCSFTNTHSAALYISFAWLYITEFTCIALQYVI